MASPTPAPKVHLASCAEAAPKRSVAGATTVPRKSVFTASATAAAVAASKGGGVSRPRDPMWSDAAS
jgi:hypothetical protein